MMVSFSESDEYAGPTESRVRAISTWFGLVRNVRSCFQTDASEAEPIAERLDLLLGSFSYALRF